MKNNITLSQKSLNAAIHLSFTILKFHGVKSADYVIIDVKNGILHLEFAADTTVKQYTIPLS